MPVSANLRDLKVQVSEGDGWELNNDRDKPSGHLTASSGTRHRVFDVRASFPGITDGMSSPSAKPMIESVLSTHTPSHGLSNQVNLRHGQSMLAYTITIPSRTRICAHDPRESPFLREASGCNWSAFRTEIRTPSLSKQAHKLRLTTSL